LNRNELPYFNIGRSYGGNQRWFLDFWMHIGRCGALTMCDLMIYMAMFRDIPEGIPFNAARLTRREYVRFGMQMKPYLKPRKTGIKDLKTFIDGADDYLRSSGIRGIEMEEFPGTETYAMAERVLKEQIDAGMPVPMLMLNHKRKEYSFFEWHWFLLVGYEDRQEGNQTVTYAKAATYGKAHWLRFDRFWETGMEERGGLIIVKEKHQ